LTVSATSGGLSQGAPGDQTISGGGLLGGGTGTAPSGGGSSASTSPTGTPSGAPYSGGGQPAGGQTGNVEGDLARTWPEWRQEWYDTIRNIIWGIKDTAEPGGEFKDAAQGAAEAAKLGIKLKAHQDAQKGLINDGAKVGDAGRDVDNRLDRREEVMKKRSLNQNDPDPCEPPKKFIEKSLE